MRKLLYLLKERNGNLRVREFCIFSRQAPDTDWQRSRILLTTRPLTVMWPKYTVNTNKKIQDTSTTHPVSQRYLEGKMAKKHNISFGGEDELCRKKKIWRKRMDEEF